MLQNIFFFGKIYGARHTTIHASYNSDEKLSLESLLLNKINPIHIGAETENFNLELTYNVQRSWFIMLKYLETSNNSLLAMTDGIFFMFIHYQLFITLRGQSEKVKGK